MSKFLLRISLLFLLVTPCMAQEGNYPLTHFTAPSSMDEFYPHDIIQDAHGVVFMAYNRGVARFDGNDWEHIRTSGSIFTLVRYGNKIYTGGPGGFGMLERGTDSPWQFLPLHPSDSTARLTDMVVHQGLLIGLSESSVCFYDLKKGTYKSQLLPGGPAYPVLLTFDKEVYLRDQDGFSYLVDKDSLIRDGGRARELAGLDYLAKAPDADVYIGGKGRDMPVLYDKRFSPIRWNNTDEEDLAYLRESEIKSAAWVSDTLVALASLKGGVIFIQPYKGRISKIINRSTGLADNEVLGFSVDRNQAVWVAHENGITRISPYLPYRTFDQLPGLEGSILSVDRYQGSMYVGTTTGLYRLERIENVRKIPVSVKASTRDNESQGFWKKIWPFKKRDQGYKTQFRRELQSVEHVFKKVDGPDSKVYHLASHGNMLFASGLDGLFMIRDGKAKKLTSVPVRYFHYSPWRDRLYMSSYEGEVYEMSPATGAGPEKIINGYTEPVSYIFEDATGNVYFCGVHTLYRVRRGNVRDTDVIATLQNPFYDETYGYAQGDSVFFLHKTTDESTTGLLTIVNDSLIASPGKMISEVIPGDKGIIWVKDDRWRQLGGDPDASIPDLSIFRNATYIKGNADENGLWIITGDNNLFFLEDRPAYHWTSPWSAFLYSVRAGEELLDPSGDLVIDQEAGSIRFTFSQAEFTRLIDLEYQYYVEGLDENWSDWSRANQEVTLSYLPAGRYTLHLRSRNSLGQAETLAPVHFKVLAPYWKRPWFYIVEFAFIGLMLLISVRMKAMGYKYRLVSRLLALLTLVIIIELIQILAESKFETETSPVVDFVIQVIIAITILPVEEILRKYIFKDKHVKVSDLLILRERRRKRRKLALKSLREPTPVDE